MKLVITVTLLLLGVASLSVAAEDWKKEFETVCCQTDNSMSMSVEQLKDSVERCDRIKPAIEALDPSPRKVYLKRWKLCRELFRYVLESKSGKQNPK